MALRKILIIMLCGGLLSCNTSYQKPSPRKHPYFTQDNVLKLRIGMTTDDVIALFGKPDRTSVHTYGQSTNSGAWQGLEYRYVFNYVVSNRLVFNLDLDPPRLNHWEIEKIWDE